MRVAPKLLLLLLMAVGPLTSGTQRHRAVSHPSTDGAPVASDDSFDTLQSTPLSIAAPGVLTNDTPNGAVVSSYGASTGLEQTSIGGSTITAEGGTIALNSDGSFLYNPAAGFTGADSFKYALTNSAGSSIAAVTITVSAPLPVAFADSFNTTAGTPLNIAAPGVLANDTPNGAKITSYGAATGSEQTSIGATTPTAHGGSIALRSDGSFVFDPAAGFTGADGFEYVLTNSGGSAAALVTITVTATPPVAVADSFNTPAGTALSVAAPGVLANDTVNGGRIVSYGAVTGSEQTSIGSPTPTAQGGTVTLSVSGAFSYTPRSGFSGGDSLRYVLQNSGGSSAATVTIAVQAPTGPDFTVTSPGFFYSISGLSGQNPVLTLTRGRTYTFKISTSSIHPFEILGAPAGSVTNNNISSGTITFAVPMTATNYQYICSVHGFGNTIQTVP